MYVKKVGDYPTSRSNCLTNIFLFTGTRLGPVFGAYHSRSTPETLKNDPHQCLMISLRVETRAVATKLECDEPLQDARSIMPSLTGNTTQPNLRNYLRLVYSAPYGFIDFIRS